MVKLKDIKCDEPQNRSVLRLIRRRKGITRVEIAEALQLSLSSVTKYANALVASGVIREIGCRDSTGGRKSVLLGVNPDFALAIGVDIGGSAAKFGVVRLDGSLVEEALYPPQYEKVPIRVMTFGDLQQHIETIIQRYGSERIQAIGIGISGLVDHQKGQVVFCPNLEGWDGVEVARLLQERFGLPVFLDTSARCTALAERWRVADHVLDDLIYITFGQASIAAGIIIDGKIYRGIGFAGEFGHIMSGDNGERCTCGNYGCLELYASLAMILEMTGKKILDFQGYSPLQQLIAESGGTQLTAAMMQQALAAGDKQCYEVIRQAGKRIGSALANVLNMFNPGQVILGGRVVELFPSILPIIQDTLRQLALVTIQRDLQLSLSKLDWHGAVIGAAYLAIDHFLE